MATNMCGRPLPGLSSSAAALPLTLPACLPAKKSRMASPGPQDSPVRLKRAARGARVVWGVAKRLLAPCASRLGAATACIMADKLLGERTAAMCHSRRCFSWEKVWSSGGEARCACWRGCPTGGLARRGLAGPIGDTSAAVPAPSAGLWQTVYAGTCRAREISHAAVRLYANLQQSRTLPLAYGLARMLNARRSGVLLSRALSATQLRSGTQVRRSEERAKAAGQRGAAAATAAAAACQQPVLHKPALLLLFAPFVVLLPRCRSWQHGKRQR